MTDVFTWMKSEGLSKEEISLNAYYLIFIKRRI